MDFVGVAAGVGREIRDRIELGRNRDQAWELVADVGELEPARGLLGNLNHGIHEARTTDKDVVGVDELSDREVRRKLTDGSRVRRIGVIANRMTAAVQLDERDRI